MRFCLIASLIASSAYGQFGIATEWTQVLNNIELVGIQAQNFKMYADMLKNSRTLDNLPWTQIEADMAKFERALAWSRAIAATMRDADVRFRKVYPGYQRVSSPYHAQYRDWSHTAFDTLTAVLRAGGSQRADMQREAAVIHRAREAAAGSQGRLEALQAQAALAAEVPMQMQKLRELMLADISSKTMFQALQLQKDATAEAAQENYFNFVAQADKGNRGFSLR